MNVLFLNKNFKQIVNFKKILNKLFNEINSHSVIMNLGYKQEGELQLKKYIYVDYENMGNIKNLIPIDGQYFFFIGNAQNSISKELVLSTNGIKIEWVSVESCGKNALDFHIAYYLGIKSSEEVYHYILSKDKGYDPLIASINKNSKRIIAKRIISLDDLQVNEEKSISPEYKILVNKINTFAKSKRPKSESKLKTFIQNQIFPNMKMDEIMNLIEEMYRNKFISKGQNNIISY